MTKNVTNPTLQSEGTLSLDRVAKAARSRPPTSQTTFSCEAVFFSRRVATSVCSGTLHLEMTLFPNRCRPKRGVPTSTESFVKAAVLAMELTGEVAQWDCAGRS